MTGKKNRCVECGNPVWEKGARCTKCSNKGKRNPMYGKHHTQKTKDKIGKAIYQEGIKKIYRINQYIGFNKESYEQILFHQKIDQNGKVQGDGYIETLYIKREGFGFNPISFMHKNCDWHHINARDVIACPSNIHNKTLHSLSGKIGIPSIKLEGVLG